MRPYILLYVTDVARSQAWYERLGFAPRRQGRHGSWAEMLWMGSEGQGFLLYLHGNPEARPAGFALPGFEVTGPLEDVAARLAPLRPVFWLETVATFAFAVSWLVKGDALRPVVRAAG